MVLWGKVQQVGILLMEFKTIRGELIEAYMWLVWVNAEKDASPDVRV